MPGRKGLLAPQNTFLDTIATRFDGTHSNFVLGNAQVNSLYPIVYCSDGFCELTGFLRAQIMQKECSCKFLYGADTQDEHKKSIENSLANKTELKIEVLFYKKNGSPFWCLLDIVPIKNEKHEVVLYLASHKDITKSKMAEMQNEEPYDNDANGNVDFDSISQHYPGDRRRSRAVLYQLSGHYKQEQKVKSKLKLNNNLLNTGALPEYKTAAIKKSRLVLSHYGVPKSCWDVLIMVATFYVAIMVPYNVAFHNDIGDRKTLIVDVIVEVIFIFDIITNFRTTFVSKKGEVVSNPKAIAVQYVRSWFIVDLIAALPFDLLYAANLYSKDMLTHLLKLTRLLRFIRLLYKMDIYSQYSAFILTLLMLFFTLIAHWLACIWYVVARYDMNNRLKGWTIGWLVALGRKLYSYHHLSNGSLHFDLDHVQVSTFDNNSSSILIPDTATSYITALYFTTSSLTSVGFGNVSPNTNREKIFSILSMLLGALMHAVVFGNVTAIIQRMYSRRSLYHTKWRDLKEFFRLHRIPKQLRQRIQDYYQTTWSLNHGIDANEVLREFPDELRADVAMHMHKEILSLPIFDTAPQGCLKQLSLHMKTNFCAPGEFLVHVGDALAYIYFVCNGSMEILQEGTVVAILGKGDLVGTDVSKSDVILKSSSDIRALTYCDLKSLHMQGLGDVLHLYPEFAETFHNEIQHDLTFNLHESQESNVSERLDNRLRCISEDDEEGSDQSCGGSENMNKDIPQIVVASPVSDDSSYFSSQTKRQRRRSLNRSESQDKCKGLEIPLSKPRQYSTHVAKRRSIKKDKMKIMSGNHIISNARLRAGSMDSIVIKTEIEQMKTNVNKLDEEVSSLGREIGTIAKDIKTTLQYVSQMSLVYSSTSCGEPSVDGSSISNLNSPCFCTRRSKEKLLPLVEQNKMLRSQSHSGTISAVNQKLSEVKEPMTDAASDSLEDPNDSPNAIILPAISFQERYDDDFASSRSTTRLLQDYNQQGSNSPSPPHESTSLDIKSFKKGSDKPPDAPLGRRRRGGLVNIDGFLSDGNPRRASESHFVNIE